VALKKHCSWHAQPRNAAHGCCSTLQHKHIWQNKVYAHAACMHCMQDMHCMHCWQRNKGDDKRHASPVTSTWLCTQAPSNQSTITSPEGNPCQERRLNPATKQADCGAVLRQEQPGHAQAASFECLTAPNLVIAPQARARALHSIKFWTRTTTILSSHPTELPGKEVTANLRRLLQSSQVMCIACCHSNRINTAKCIECI
jgi:hypothetical protein